MTVLPDPHLDLFRGPDGADGFDQLLDEAAEALGMAVVLVGHVNETRYTVVAFRSRDPKGGFRRGDTLPIEETYCRQEITWERPFVLGDALLDPVFARHPGFVKHKLRAYAGAPIVLPDGSVYGTLCGVDTEPKVPSLAAVERLIEISHELSAEIWRRLTAAPRSDEGRHGPPRAS